MKTIIYHPSFSSRAYMDLQRRGGIALEESVMGDQALLDYLELVCGLHCREEEYEDLLGRYHNAMEKVMLEGENILTPSWSVNPLAVAEQCLAWRNQLRLSGWDPGSPAAFQVVASERLGILARIEKVFSESGENGVEDTAFRIDRLIKALTSEVLEPLKIRVALESLDTLPWKWQQLLRLLQNTPNVVVEMTIPKPCAPQGTNLRQIQEFILEGESGYEEDEGSSISKPEVNSGNKTNTQFDKKSEKLSDNTSDSNPKRSTNTKQKAKKHLHLIPGDSSLRIWKFPSDVDACRYFSHIPCQRFDVRVCSDTVVSSCVRRMLGLPSVGAQISKALPQVAQLFRIGITLWKAPLNLNTLLAWLVAPYHPLSWKIKNRLANVISTECGVNNEAYRKAISEYIDSLVDGDSKPLRDQQKKEMEMIQVLIPTDIEDQKISKDRLLKFIGMMKGWSQKSIFNEVYDQMVRSQMAYLYQKYKALEQLVLKCKGDTVAYEQLESWMCTLDTGAAYVLDKCQAGSPYIVSPNDIAEACQRVLWTDCYNYTPYAPSDSFLCPREKQQLEKCGCHFPDPHKVNLQAYRDSMLPVLMAKEEVVLCLVENSNGEHPSTHPLVIMLETLTSEKAAKNKNGLDAITEYPHCREYESERVERVSWQPKSSRIELRNKEMIEMRASESYSSLDLLFQYPVDYLAQYQLGFHTANVFSIPELDTTKGTVAHAVIEHLFKGTAAEIKNRISESFDDILKSMITQKGAILLLEENTLTKRQFEMDLRENVEALCQVLEANNLRVYGNEYPIATILSEITYEDLPSSSTKTNKDKTMRQLEQLPGKFNGFVDLLLEDNLGRKYIIDLKWTRSKRYKAFLENDTSLQLALYEFFTGIRTASEVGATGYFLMPKHQLFTASESLRGPNVIRVNIQVPQTFSGIQDNQDGQCEPEGTDRQSEAQGLYHTLWDKICNTYVYRREQLLNGILENAEDEMMDQIQYVLDTDKFGLVPLSEYDGAHSSNLYSDITYLKINNLN